MPETYSVDQLKTWSECQKRYEYQYVRKLNWPSDPKNFRLGKGVHQLLDYGARGLPLEALLPGVDEDIQSYWRLLAASRWASLPVLASEWGFSLEVAGRWIYGRIDRIVQDGDRVLILDWKTGTAMPADAEDDWQTVVYLYALYQSQRHLGLSLPAEQFAFTYVQVRGQAIEEKTIPYSEARHAEVGRRLAETLPRLNLGDAYRLPAACPNRFCVYTSVCGIQDTSAGK